MRNRFILSLLIALCLWSVLASAHAQKRNKQEPPKEPPKAEEQGRDTISVDTNLVVLNVTITDAKARYVAGLKAENFSLFEDNVPQRIASFGFEETPFVAAILIDTSASMEQKMSLARTACSRFADGIREGDSVAIYSFGGTTVKQLQSFTESRDVDPAVW
jgi:Ca-activated chloride channel family protein